jgi:hypothetical protein
MRQHLIRMVQFAVGIGILYLLLRRAELERALAMVGSIRPMDAVFTLVGFFIASILLGASLVLLLPGPVTWGTARRVLQAHLAGVLLSDVTPARSGYFLTPLLMERLEGIGRETGFAALAGMQAVSLVAKAVLAGAAILLVGHRLQERLHMAEVVPYVLAGSTLLVAAGVVFGLLAWTPIMDTLARFLARRVTARRVQSLLNLTIKFTEKFRASGRETYRRSPLAGALAAASTLAAGGALFPIAQAVGLTGFGILDIMAVGVIVGPLVYLPISPAGIGVIEAAYVFVLTTMGQDQSASLAFALASRALFTGTDLVGLPWLLTSLNRRSGILVNQARGSPE